MESGIFEKLNRDLMDSKSSIRFNAVKTIAEVVDENSENCQHIIDAGIVSNLIKLLDVSMDKELCKLVLNVLECISYKDGNYKQVIIDAGGIAAISKFFASDNEDICKLAAETMENICYEISSQGKTIINVEDCVNLVKLLSAKNEEILYSAMSILIEISMLTNEQKQSIIDAGAVPYLIKLINSPNNEIRRCSAEALNEICNAGAELSQAVVAAGLIPALMTYFDLLMEPLDADDNYICLLFAAMLTYMCNLSTDLKQVIDDSGIRLAADKALEYEIIEDESSVAETDSNEESQNIEQDEVSETAVGDSSQAQLFDFINNCVTQILSMDSETCKSGLQTLVSEFEGKKDSIVFKGDTVDQLQRQLVKLLTHYDVDISKHALCLVNFFCVQEQFQTMAEIGVIPLLVELLGVMDLFISEKAVECLKCITGRSSTNELRQAVIDSGALPYLVILLQSSNTNICSTAAQICTDLCASTMNMKQAVYEAEAIPSLINLFNSSDLQTRMSAFWTASLFSNGTEEQRKALVDAGAVQQLLNLYESPDFKEFKGQITGTLSNIAAGSSSIKNLIIQKNGLLNLIQEISVPGSRECFQTLIAIRNFSFGSEEICEAIINAGAVPYLIKLLEPFNSPFCPHALVILRNLSTNPLTTKVLVESGSIPLLLKFLNFPESDVCVNALKIFSCIARHSDENKNALIKAGVIRFLVTFLQLPFVKVSKAACMVIQCLSIGSEGFRKTLIDAGVINPLKMLSKCPDMEMCVIACTALDNICVSAEQKDIQEYIDFFIELIPNEFLNDVLSSDSLRFHMVKTALGGLNNVIYIRENQNTIDYTETLSKLATILSSSNDAFYEMAVRIILTIADGTNREIMSIIDAGIVPLLIKLLEYPTESFCVESLAALGNIAAQQTEQKKALVDAGVLPLLSNFLHLENFTVVERAAGVLGNLIFEGVQQNEAFTTAVSRLVELLALSDQSICTFAGVITNISAGSVELKQLLIDSNAVPILFRLIEFPESLKFKFAAAAVANIADGTPEQKRFLVDVGSIPFFVQCLNYENAFLEASRGFANITKIGSVENQLIIDNGALPQLCKLFSFSDPNICKQVALALTNIAFGNIEQKQAIIDAGVLPRIAEYLNNFILKRDVFEDSSTPKKIIIDKRFYALGSQEQNMFSMKLCIQVMDLLLNISEGSIEQHGAIIEAKILPHLIKLLNPLLSMVCVKSVFVLTNIASTGKREDIIKEGAIFCLIKLLRFQEYEACAANAIRNIVFKSLNGREALIQAGALPILVKLLNSENTESCINATWVLSEVSEGIPNQANDVISAGALPHFKKLLDSTNVKVCKAAAVAIFTLCKGFPQQIEAVFEAGVIEPLISLLSNPEICNIAAWTIVSITGSKEEYVNAFIQAKVIAPLIQLLESSDLEACIAAMAAITNICKTNEGMKATLQTDALTNLLFLLNSSDNRICEAAFMSVSNIFSRNNFVNVYEGFISTFVKLLKNNDFGLHNNLINLLSHIACGSSQNRKKLIEAGIIPTILQYTSHPETEIKKSAVSALANIARDTTEDIDEIVNSGKISDFVPFFYSADQDTQRAAAILFENIAFCSVKHKQIIVDIKVIPRLIELIQSDDLLTAEYTAKVLKQIANGTAEQCQKTIEEGAVEPLVKLLVVPNSKANVLAGQIIKDMLSKEYNKSETMTILLKELQNGVEEIFTEKEKVSEILEKLGCWGVIQNLQHHDNTEISNAAKSLTHVVSDK